MTDNNIQEIKEDINTNIIEFIPSSSEILIKFNPEYDESKKLYYSLYGKLYYSWNLIELTPNTKQYNLINLVPDTYYVFSYDNKTYTIKTQTESEEILKLKVELDHIKNNNIELKKTNVINLYKKNEEINKGIINNLNISNKELKLNNFNLITTCNKNSQKIIDLTNELINVKENMAKQIEALESKILDYKYEIDVNTNTIESYKNDIDCYKSKIDIMKIMV